MFSQATMSARRRGSRGGSVDRLGWTTLASARLSRRGNHTRAWCTSIYCSTGCLRLESWNRSLAIVTTCPPETFVDLCRNSTKDVGLNSSKRLAFNCCRSHSTIVRNRFGNLCHVLTALVDEHLRKIHIASVAASRC